MNLHEEITRMTSIMGLLSESRERKLLEKVLSIIEPNFNNENVDVVSKLDFVLWFLDKNDPSIIYAKYWIHDKELQIGRELFESIENFLNDDFLNELIDWFNDEFGTGAESITF